MVTFAELIAFVAGALLKPLTCNLPCIVPWFDWTVTSASVTSAPEELPVELTLEVALMLKRYVLPAVAELEMLLITTKSVWLETLYWKPVNTYCPFVVVFTVGPIC